MAIEINGIELTNVHRITTTESGGHIQQQVPGMEGDVSQDIGRQSLQLQIDGIFYGKDIEKDLKVQFTPDDFALLVTLSKHKESHINTTLLKRLLEAYGAIGYARIPQLPLELALIETLQEKRDT